MLQAHTGYDLAIIGSGGGAFAAAIAARNKGKRVVMVERGTTGGTCVNVGCVPSKALLAAAEARHGAQAAGRFPGLAPATVPVDFPALIGGKDALVEQLRTEKYTDLAADYGWQIVHGTATFADGPVLQVALNDGGTTTIEAAHYLIATGSTPWAPPIDGLDETGYLTSTTAMELEELPEHLLVLGGGYVGLEQAQLFARLGSRVTMAVRSRLASGEEPEISAGIEAVFADEGITVHTRTQVSAVRRDGDGILATLTGPGGEQQVRASHLLVATGRRPVTDGLGLERVGVKTGERGEVVVDEYLRTGNPRIWAAGDVTGHPDFVYVAAAHGTLVADNALDGAERTLDYTALPKVTFTSPAIASVGMTDAQLAEAGIACQCRTLPLQYVPRALANRDTRGLVKLIAERGTGKLLGAHVLADGAGDIITAATYAITAGLTVDQIARTWHPYLTMAEALKLAAQTFTSDVARLSCCAG
ncbi:mercury(II) reductase [Streptomyces diastaticus]|uniref:Mercuric reductase n=2 Tax=Streptomyces TaxID=1883 RepID=A0ABP7DWV6_9ACTN|nr:MULTISPECIES: mercury(II) reductase [Streptomyces]MBZ3908405.1 mercury(II) reductase [Streptomyces griseiscabiei]MDX2913922.1 mercury(II) reductase [Streptomyces griseiscabiei]GHE39387.1 mercuric reductase MerA [Streptomyces cellulosae]